MKKLTSLTLLILFVLELQVFAGLGSHRDNLHFVSGAQTSAPQAPAAATPAQQPVQPAQSRPPDLQVRQRPRVLCLRTGRRSNSG